MKEEDSIFEKSKSSKQSNMILKAHSPAEFSQASSIFENR